MKGNRSASLQADTRCSLYLHIAETGDEKESSLKDSRLKHLTAGLQAIGFTGPALNEDGDRFYTGEKFLDYIAYMGCSPAVSFTASKNGSDFCHIRIHHYDNPELIHSRLQAREPICPLCKKPVKGWRLANTQIHCPHCSHRSPAAGFNWRKMAGVSTLFLEITDIFPREAIPQQMLLDRLAGIYPAKWRYFYSCR